MFNKIYGVKNYSCTPILMLIASILGPMSTAILTPALPLIESSFDSNIYSVKQVMNLNLASIAISGIIYGGISESFGRRLIFLIGISLFSMGALMSYFVNNLQLLIASQIVQGCGIGVSSITSAVIGDVYHGKKSIQLISFFGIFVPLSVHLSPLIGGFIVQYISWKFIFFAQFFVGVCFLILLYFVFPETLSIYHPYSFKEQINVYVNTFKNSLFIKLMCVMCLPFSGLWIYNTTAPFMFIQQFAVSPLEYGIYPIISASGLILGNIFVNRTIDFLEISLVLKIGGGVLLIGIISILSLIVCSYHTPIAFAICMGIYYFGCAPIFSIGLVLAMNIGLNKKGYITALIRGGQFIVASIIGVISGLFYIESFIFFGIIMLLCALITNLLVWNLLNSLIISNFLKKIKDSTSKSYN